MQVCRDQGVSPRKQSSKQGSACISSWFGMSGLRWDGFHQWHRHSGLHSSSRTLLGSGEISHHSADIPSDWQTVLECSKTNQPSYQCWLFVIFKLHLLQLLSIRDLHLGMHLVRSLLVPRFTTSKLTLCSKVTIASCAILFVYQMGMRRTTPYSQSDLKT